MDKFEQERDWIASQEAHFDYIEGCVMGEMFSSENMRMLRKGFDLVCTVNRGSMLAGDCIMACVCKGEAEAFARRYQKKTKIGNLVVIYADGPRACDWLIVNETVFL